jgi:energy-coupling factor transport system substrate-specific component
VAVLAVVFGFLYMQWLPLWTAAKAAGQPAQEFLFGFWLAAGVLASYIIRRPGAALVGEFLAALAEVIFGAAAGPPLLVTGIMQGLGAELVFGAREWRDYRWPVVILAGVGAAVVAIPWNWMRLGYFELNAGFLVVLFIARVAGGALLGGVFPKLLGDALARTGVLSGFGLGRERQEVVYPSNSITNRF